MCNVIVVRVTGGKFINYSYIIYDDNGVGILLDPAWEREKIINIIKENDIEIKAVFITHEHQDHTNLAEYMAIYYNIPIYSSKEVQCMFTVDNENLIVIESENQITINKLTVKPFFTPGHTSGGISYLINGNLFSGDTLFIEGCGMYEDKNSDPIQLFKSLRRFAEDIPLVTNIYPGHRYHAKVGQPFSYVLDNNIYLNILAEQDFVNFRMRRKQKEWLDFI